MSEMIHSVLETYLRTYRELMAVEPIDEDSATISFPFHLAGSHRIELTVTDVGFERCIISDAGRTTGELEAAGYCLTRSLREKLEGIAQQSGIRVVDDYLLLDTTYADVGLSMQRFLETSKVIGDVYLVHRQHERPEDDLVAEVRGVLDSRKILYREQQKLTGELELHPFNLVVPPNGHAGLAVSILGSQNTHQQAQIWGYKCFDIRRKEENSNIKLALVYDVRFWNWSPISKAILKAGADIAIPGDSLSDLPAQLEIQGVIVRS